MQVPWHVNSRTAAEARRCRFNWLHRQRRAHRPVAPTCRAAWLRGMLSAAPRPVSAVHNVGRSNGGTVARWNPGFRPLLVVLLAAHGVVACQTTKARYSSSTFATQAECQAAGEVCQFGCPPWMATVSVAGHEVCMDFYEVPPGKNLVPRTRLSWPAAVALCRDFDKRLCTVDEWSTACAGIDATASTTDCNCSERRSPVSPASFPRCRSPANVFHLPCNVDEWTATQGDVQQTHVVMGGVRDGKLDCGASRVVDDQSVEALLGTRCCSSPAWYVPKRFVPHAAP